MVQGTVTGLHRGACRHPLGLATAGLLVLLLGGCHVPQPRGNGTLQLLTEPSTQRSYYLYLPEDYVQASEEDRAARSWPLIMNFHGMKPYDVAWFQALEWQQEADRYGYIVASPELRTFDFLLGEFPLQRINKEFRGDELATLAVMDHVFRTTRADPRHVLSTGFSSGGYIAHYMLNRHPERFTALVSRQGNFSAIVLDSEWAKRSIYHPVLVLTTELDVPICKEESDEAKTWYETHGYRNFAWVHLGRLGHERTPDLAADFFARVCGATPKTPPDILSRRIARDGNPAGLELMAGGLRELERDPRMAAYASADSQVGRYETPRRPQVVAGPGRDADLPSHTAPDAGPHDKSTGSASATNKTALQHSGLTTVARPPGKDPPDPIHEEHATPFDPLLATATIRVSATVGFEPLLLVYAADCPAAWIDSATFAWLLNGEPLGKGLQGERLLKLAGDYLLEVRIVTNEGREHRAERRIRVLPRLQQDELLEEVSARR
ncbi:MAG: prolyl oligopeptidase family serine peptidase [Phycisphaerales bacterium]|nr:prolyl oligopeptidase family serine peptidase [Phycisphaerales bacterium]